MARAKAAAKQATPHAGAAERALPTHDIPWMLPERPRVTLLVKRSLFRLFIEEKRDERMQELLLRGDATVARLEEAHAAHERAVSEARAALDAIGAVVTELERFPDEGETLDADLLVSVGGDGTLLRASHAAGRTPVLGVNSAPDHSVGFFCGTRGSTLLDALRRAQRGAIASATLTRMEVLVGDRVVSSRVLNDALFCHASPAATSRYIVELKPAAGAFAAEGSVAEEQKSSGFWIGPAAGSTAAQCSAGGKVLPLESEALQLVVREPYTPKGERYRLRHTLVQPGEELVVRSKIRDATLFVDGPDEVHRMGYGDVLRFRKAAEPLVVLGLHAKRRWGAR
jgi:NAD+ kinase